MFPLFGLSALLVPLALRIAEWFLGLKLASTAFKIALMGVLLGLILAFIAASMAIASGFVTLAPIEFRFAFGILPDSVPIMFGAYIGVLVAAKVLEFKSKFILHAFTR